MRHDLHFDGPVWRLLPEGLSATPMIAAQAPEGRFHHSGQVAAYASLSAEGAFVAMRRYFDDGINRVLIPMWLSLTVLLISAEMHVLRWFGRMIVLPAKCRRHGLFPMRQEMLEPKPCSIRHDHAQSFHML